MKAVVLAEYALEPNWTTRYIRVCRKYMLCLARKDGRSTDRVTK